MPLQNQQFSKGVKRFRIKIMNIETLSEKNSSYKKKREKNSCRKRIKW